MRPGRPSQDATQAPQPLYVYTPNQISTPPVKRPLSPGSPGESKNRNRKPDLVPEHRTASGITRAPIRYEKVYP